MSAPTSCSPGAPRGHELPRLHRILGLSDLVFFLIAALVNLNSVPMVAGAGPGALALWLLAFLFFFLPQGIAVLELSTRYPQEGGIYQWSKIAFGDFHGFISGWCYWTNNIFYVPTLLFYIVGFAAFLGGEGTRGIGRDPLVMAPVSLLLLWMITWLNVRGFTVGRWVQAVGAAGTFVVALLLASLAFVLLRQHGMATALSWSTFAPQLSAWGTVSLLGVVCLNFVGLELGAVIGEEIKEPRRNLPRAAMIAGACTVTLYLVTTFALQAIAPASDIGVIDGILQAVRSAAGDVGLPWIVVPAALLMSMNAAGNTSAWLAGSARVPFVIGIDRYLPSALGRIHPRHHTPHVALVAQAIASSVFIGIAAVGSTVHDMYLILLQTTVILQLIPYLYMFGGLLRVLADPLRGRAGEGFCGSRTWVGRVAGLVGLVVTAAGVVFAFVPSTGIDDAGGFILKTLLGFLGLVVPAVLLYRRNSRRARHAGMVAPGVEVAPD